MQGKTIADKYQIVEKLREQRFYDLYIAHSENSGRQVLLKLIKPEISGETTFETIKADLGVVASLRHNGVSPLRDFGVDAGRIYLVEDYFDGTPLTEVIRRAGAVNAYHTLNQGIKIADIVSAAHSRGIMHGLLTPESVSMGRDLSVRVGDFYFLYALTAELRTSREFQGRDIIYCAPEVIAGGKPTMASDVYSTGVILYELLTGRPPFDREGALSVALKKETLKPRAPRELNPDIPRLLDTVIMKCLKNDPEARYPDARRLVSELHLCRSSLARSMSEQSETGHQPVEQKGESDGLINMGGFVRSNEELKAAVSPAKFIESSSWNADARGSDEENEMETEGKRRLPQGFVLFMVSLFVLISLLIFGVHFVKVFFDGAGSSGGNVVVPIVVNKNMVEAKAVLAQSGLVPVEEAAQFSSEIPSGFILKQEPPAGSTVKGGREVHLTPSAGEKKVAVPRFVGLSLEDATVLLEQAGFQVGELREVFDEHVMKGYVVEQTPEEGREAMAGQRIILTTSKGIAPRLINMPRVTDLSAFDAKSILAMNDIESVNVVKLVSGGVSGFVIAQSVLEGVRITPDQEVTLYVVEPPPSTVFHEIKGVVNLKISTDNEFQEVVVLVYDQDGGREVYRKTHMNGDDVKVTVSGYGKTHIKVYLDGIVAKEQTL